MQIREFVVFGFWNFLGEREKKKKKKTRGRKNSPPFLFSLFYNNDNANNNSTSARTARSAPRSGSRSGRSSGRQASLFLYSPPFFFHNSTTTTGTRERVPNNSYLTRSLFHLDCTTTTKKCFLSTGAYAGKY